MRKILFRGQTRRYGEKVNMAGEKLPSKWVYGGIFSGTGDFSVIYGAGKEDFTGADIEKHVVYSGTVGQYTGLKDKNGTRIFEGDILRIAKESDGNGTYFVPPLEYPVRAVVKWDLCAWTWETLCEDKRYITFPEAWCHFECEVIGNIHDNPELKGDAND